MLKKERKKVGDGAYENSSQTQLVLTYSECRFPAIFLFWPPRWTIRADPSSVHISCVFKGWNHLPCRTCAASHKSDHLSCTGKFDRWSVRGEYKPLELDRQIMSATQDWSAGVKSSHPYVTVSSPLTGRYRVSVGTLDWNATAIVSVVVICWNFGIWFLCSRLLFLSALILQCSN